MSLLVRKLHVDETKKYSSDEDDSESGPNINPASSPDEEQLAELEISNVLGDDKGHA